MLNSLKLNLKTLEELLVKQLDLVTIQEIETQQQKIARLNQELNAIRTKIAQLQQP